MQGGYNIETLLSALDNPELAPIAVEALSKTLLMFDNFHDVKERADQGNPFAQQVLESWANADWFTSRPKLAEKLTVTVFKSQAKPIPMIFPRLKTLGLALIFHFTH